MRRKGLGFCSAEVVTKGDRVDIQAVRVTLSSADYREDRGHRQGMGRVVWIYPVLKIVRGGRLENQVSPKTLAFFG